MSSVWVAILWIALTASPAAGQRALEYGIGFVHADERTFFCRDPDPVEALACARDQCHEMAPGQSCVRAAWCFPSGWSAIVKFRRGDLALPGAICGAPTEIATQRTVAEYCRESDSVTSCDLTHLVDPAGFEHAVEGMEFPGGAPPEGDRVAEESPPDNGAPADAVPTGVSQDSGGPVGVEPVAAEGALPQ